MGHRTRRAIVNIGDFLIFLLFLAWIHSELVGGMRIHIGDVELSNRDNLRVLLQLALVVLVRHLLVPTPSLPQRIRNWTVVSVSPSRLEQLHIATDRAPSLKGLVTRTVVITRLLVLTAGVLGVYCLPLTGDPMRDENLESAQVAPLRTLQSKWDSGWYASIAVSGYRWDPSTASSAGQNVAFFPAFPLLVGATLAVGEGVGAVALLPTPESSNMHAEMVGGFVAITAFAIALILLYRLAALDLPPGACRRAVILCATYPFAYFFSAPYTESLFLMAVLGAFLSLRQGKTWWLCACGVLIGLTKHSGFLVAVPLLAATLAFAKDRRITARETLRAMSPIVGAIVFSAYLWWKFGDPIAWVRAQGGWKPVHHWAHLMSAGSPLDYLMTFPFEAANLAAVLVIIPLIWASRRIQASYCIFGVTTLIVPLVMDVAPLGRITSTVFPAFFALAAMPLHQRAFRALAAVWFLLQLLCAALFYSWRPLY